MPDNEGWIRDWYKTRDYDTYLSEDVEFDVMDGFPAGGRYRGRAEVAAFFETFFSFFSSFTPTIEDVIDAGRAVTTLGTYSGVLGANGASFSLPFCHIWYVADRRVIRMVGLANGYIMEAAINRPPKP